MLKEVGNMKIGVLALQGGIIEHLRLIEAAGAEAKIVRYNQDLEDIDGLILPGGESTTISKILNRTNMMKDLRTRILAGLPVWGTCAGMILLAKNLSNDDKVDGIKTMDITVRRNAYGTQIDSFNTLVNVPEVSENEIPLVFIRAPFIEETGNNVKVICEVNGHIVAARQDNMLVSSFHPELTSNTDFHKYFINMCK